MRRLLLPVLSAGVIAAPIPVALAQIGNETEEMFFKKPSPDGPGMQCTNSNTYGYIQVEAGATQMKVTLKDIDGKTIKEEGDNPRTCGPYVLKAK